MAIYHFTARIVSRGKGQSAVHKAAYNARTQLQDERHGLKTRDYRSEGEILFSGIFAPKHAPEWVQDREQLWNRAEAAEQRKDAQLAREIEIALPHELTDQQREGLVKDFVREQFVRRGMVADVAIHAPDRDGDERNHHAHILLTTRALDGDGFAATKDRDWNSKALLQEWRERWDRTANRYLERFGHAARIDHRTLAAQGIDREPTVHLGPHVAAMEARGLETGRGEQLRDITTRNHEQAGLRQELRSVEASTHALDTSLAAQQESSAAFQEHQRLERLERGADALERQRDFTPTLDPDLADVAGEAVNLADRTLGVTSTLAGGVVNAAGKVLDGLIDMVAGGPPPPTSEERRAAEKEYLRRLSSDATFRAAARQRLADAARQNEQQEQEVKRERDDEWYRGRELRRGR